MASNWSVNLSQGVAPTGNVTTLKPFNNDNSSAVIVGSLGVISVATLGTCTAVSDNTNGSWTKIQAATNTGFEVSLWYFKNMAATAINSLVTTITTTSAHGCAHCRILGLSGGGVAPNGNLADFGTASGTGTNAVASAYVYTPGLWIVSAIANKTNVNATNPTGDTDVANSDAPGQDIILFNARIGSGLGDSNTGSRSGGMTLNSSTAWAAVTATFWWDTPSGAFQGYVGGWVNVGIQKKVSGAWTTVEVDYKKNGTWVQKA